MENQELIKQVTEKAEKWLTPAYVVCVASWVPVQTA